MCGFAGFIGPGCERDAGWAVLGRMAAAMARRGPDEEGRWLDEDGTVGLAHRRLAVVGLGEQGRQPMASVSGRWIIAYNGEIYNRDELRCDLTHRGVLFRGQSDTEVLLAAIECYGLADALTRVVGMFAFALWNAAERRLILARDRFGEKPLYYGWQGATFLFGSTLQPLRQHPAWIGGVDHRALALLTRYNYVPAPLSIHPGIAKLLPGTWLELVWREGRWTERRETYWSAMAAVRAAKSKPFGGSVDEAAESLASLMRQVVGGQMMTEVPLGAFLSGGVDSSAIVALMQSQSGQPVRTFTIGFDNPEYDESPAAEAVARHLGTEHTTCMLSAADVIGLIPELPAFYDEPFADASQLPTTLVSRVARQQVTVALSGDGGDEIFGGYNRYRWGPRLQRWTTKIPTPLLRGAAGTLQGVSPAVWDTLAGWLPSSGHARHPGEKLHKLAGLLDAAEPMEMYRRMATFWHAGSPVAEGEAVGGAMLDDAVWREHYPFGEQMMLADTLTYLPDDVLVKVDRAAMGVSLETRAPFLDHRLFELLWSLPLDYRVQENESKVLLRRLLYRHVPKVLIERPKSGFALPISDYLRGPLRDWAESLLSESQLRGDGYFDAAKIRQAWQEHCSGRANRQYDLWSVLAFQNWLKSQC